MFFGITESCLDINHLLVRKTGPIHLGLVGLTAGWLTDKTDMGGV